MTSNSPSSTEYLRRGLLKIAPETILAAVDALNLKGNSRVSAVVGMPLRGLQQRRDVAAFAIAAPPAAVRAVLELLAMAPLEQVIAELGDHADSPTHEQLEGAIDALLAREVTTDEIVALLTFAISEEFPAAPHCRRLLDERAGWALPPLPEFNVSPTLMSPKVVDPEIRAQRQARREEEKRRKKGGSAPRSMPKTRTPRALPSTTSEPLPVSTIEPGLVTDRRRVMLTPVEEARFSGSHPLVGTVVIVELPFDNGTIDEELRRAKERPALVIAASDQELLVRGIYSNPWSTRVVFQPWRRLNLEHLSYIDHDRSPVSVPESLNRLGQLTNEEWNALF